MRAIPENIGVIHFVGIGGIGMSGIAEILHNMGYKVQGSDLSEGGNVTRLRDNGVRVETGHRAENIMAQGKPPAVVVVSSAVKKDNPEVMAAREAGVPVIRRAEMLAELMRLKRSISIGGTHGKTTTTSLIGTVLEGGGLDPTVINGGIVNAYGTNVRMGEGDWMVVEADESDGTFVKLPSTVVIVTNIDPEHMDHYSSFDELKNTFRQFVLNIPFYGFGVLCLDHPEVQAMIPRIGDRRIITYGFNPQAHVRAENVTGIPGGNRFDVVLSAKQFGQERVIRGISLPMLGLHNVQNALAAIATGVALGVSDEQLRNSLGAFTGVKRRFTRTGESNGITVIDDYGHHPVEITAVLKAARADLNTRGKGRTVAIVQPHRYTRLSSLFDEFCTCFNDADTVIVADVYAAGEEPIAGANRQALVDGLKSHGHKDVRSLESPDDLAAMVADIAKSGDFAICLGAGNITQWAYKLPQQLDEIFAARKKQSKGKA